MELCRQEFITPMVRVCRCFASPGYFEGSLDRYKAFRDVPVNQAAIDITPRTGCLSLVI